MTTQETPPRAGQREDASDDLVSVLHHARTIAAAMAEHVARAERARDDELASFFEDVRRSEAGIARKARALLAARLEHGRGDEDDGTVIDDEGDRVAPMR